MSGSEDEKRFKKAREAASRKRRQKDLLASDRGKRPRVSMGTDNQIFRGKSYCLHITSWIQMVLDPLAHPCFHRSTSSDTLRSGKISYTTCRDILTDTLTQLGCNPK